MSSPETYNQRIMKAFRANGGNVDGSDPLVLLTTTVAKSGQPRTTPVVYSTDGDHLIIAASNDGAPTNPDWYHNLLVYPLMTVKLGAERFHAQATVVAGPERERLFAQHPALMPGFAEHQHKTTRQIPVVRPDRVR